MDTLLDALQLHVLVSLPQTFITWLFVFSLLRPQPNKLIARILILTVVHSVYTDLLILYIPTYLQLINTLFAMVVLIFLLFKELPLRKKIFLFVGGVLFGIAMDMISSGIAIANGIEDLNSLRREHLFTLVSIIYPQLILILIAAWSIRKRVTFSSIKLLTVNIAEKRALLKVIALVLVQFFTLGVMETLKFASEAGGHILTILIYFTMVISLAALVFMLRMLTLTRADAIRSTQAIYVDDINNMFTSIRGQRHDFLNHVQVIHSMAQMGKFDQLQAYTSTLVQETREVSEIINHASPALAAFAQAKTTVALGLGIAFKCELPTVWNVQESAIAMIDLIKILGNLVDNAFDETMRLPIEQRMVHVSIKTFNDVISLEVANSGHPMTPEVRDRMFQHGYSTKGEGHSGLGLAIVRERVSHYQGNIDVDSNKDERKTTFRVTLPHLEPIAG
ncbi:sensor histidine kinase [Cohnella yongneupensis]|uniref:histidine kinase n=1 Tax=Cohnella yongneupensis TaxID=425006 RepID=A0ABW0QYZ2_9BACL